MRAYTIDNPDLARLAADLLSRPDVMDVVVHECGLTVHRWGGDVLRFVWYSVTSTWGWTIISHLRQGAVGSPRMRWRYS